MQVKVASLGKDKSGLFAPAVEEYAQRLSHYCRFSLLELAPSRRNGEQAKEEEADKLLELKTPRTLLVALDERGKLLNSLEFSHFFSKAQTTGQDVVLVLGGDEGLSTRVTQQAQLTLALSRMTLPHRLARLVLVEQIYRAMTLLRGEPYHK